MSSSIYPGSRITLNFAIRFMDGQEVDSTFDKEPAVFRLGDGNMLPGFEEFLLGLMVGAESAMLNAGK